MIDITSELIQKAKSLTRSQFTFSCRTLGNKEQLQEIWDKVQNGSLKVSKVEKSSYISEEDNTKVTISELGGIGIVETEILPLTQIKEKQKKKVEVKPTSTEFIDLTTEMEQQVEDIKSSVPKKAEQIRKVYDLGVHNIKQIVKLLGVDYANCYDTIKAYQKKLEGQKLPLESETKLKKNKLGT